MLRPWSSSSRANSTIRIAFLQASAASTTRPTWVKMLLSPPVSHTPPMAASTDSGTIRITTSGSDQLSYCAASTRKASSTERGKTSSSVAPFLHLLVGELGPLEAHPPRQGLQRQPLHERDRLAGADPGREAAVDIGRGERVVVHDPVGAEGLPSPDQRAERHHLTRRLRTRRLPMSSTWLRKGPSAWATTWYVRPKRLKSLTYAEPR